MAISRRILFISCSKAPKSGKETTGLPTPLTPQGRGIAIGRSVRLPGDHASCAWPFRSSEGFRFTGQGMSVVELDSEETAL